MLFRSVVDQALEQEDISRDDLIHVIHKLHGSSSYCGVPRLKSLCATLEQALRSGISLEEVEQTLVNYLALNSLYVQIQTVAR